MRSINEFTNKSYVLTSVSEKSYSCSSKVIDEFKESLIKEIKKLENRLSELKEVRENTFDMIYLIKDTDSNYGYHDANGEYYKYVVLVDKHALVNVNTCETYEMIECCDVRNTQDINTASWCIDAYVDKVIKVRKVK